MRDDSFEKLLDFVLGNEENAKIICSFIDDLTPDGFEHYISDYYKKIYGFTTAVNGGFHDKGIDVKGLRIDEKGEREHLIVQCKKWNWAPKGVKDKYYIGENLISQFYGKVADIKNSWNVRLVYATTKDVTPGAKIFCKEKNIDLITFKELVEFNEKMNLKEWIEAVLESPISYTKKESLISKEYLERRKRFLEQKKAIEQDTMIKIALEKSKTTNYDRYANLDKTKLVLKRTDIVNDDISQSIYTGNKEGSWMVLGSYLVTVFTILFFLILFFSFLFSSTRKSAQQSEVTKIDMVQNVVENIAPNKKKNIQKTIHKVTP